MNMKNYRQKISKNQKRLEERNERKKSKKKTRLEVAKIIKILSLDYKLKARKTLPSLKEKVSTAEKLTIRKFSQAPLKGNLKKQRKRLQLARKNNKIIAAIKARQLKIKKN